MLPDVSYEHRLDPRTGANLTAAILTVGNLLGVSPIADSVLEHLKDRIGDTLSASQRLDPNAIYASDLLGLVAEYVKETFGIDRPANLHAAPQGPQTKEIPIGSDSVFALDGLGRNRFEQLTGATSGSYARMVADVASSSAAYSAMSWNPASGAAGLTAFNFGGTPFAQNGLDLATTQYLFSQGFSQPQIINAATDMKALSFNPKNQRLAEGFATQERFDPAGRGQRQQADQSWKAFASENADEINRRWTIVQSLQPGTPEYEAAVGDLNSLLRQGYVDTGQSAVDERLTTVDPASGAQPGDRERSLQAQIEKREEALRLEGVSPELIEHLGPQGTLEATDAQLTQLDADAGTTALSSEMDAVAAGVTSVARGMAPPDEEDFGVVPPAADNPPASDMDDFGVAPTSPAAATEREAPADANAARHPGKEEDDKVTSEPGRTHAATAPLKPPAPSAG